MSRRALALLCLAACAAPEPAAPPPAPASGRGEGPVPSDSQRAEQPVLEDSPPVPSDSHPRLLAAEVSRFGVLADGAVLIEPHGTWRETAGEPSYVPPPGLERLDPTTGARTPWRAAWAPEGWQLARGGEPTLVSFEVSPDGRWVALAHSLEIRRNPALARPELIALVIARGDGSEPRCIGVGVPGDDPPPYTFSRDGRVIGDWTVRCAAGPRGVPVALDADADLESWPRLQKWYDPDDGSSGVVPELEPWWYDRDPLGDHVMMQDQQEEPRALVFRNFATGARLGAVLLGDGPGLRARAWVGADMLLAEVLTADPALAGLRLLTTDGRAFPAPHARWRVYTRLPDGAHLFSRDGGATIEQGHVDWPRFTVTSSRRRPDLEAFLRASTGSEPRVTEPRWTPGLGGVLIHDEQTGNLHLAAI